MPRWSAVVLLGLGELTMAARNRPDVGRRATRPRVGGARRARCRVHDQALRTGTTGRKRCGGRAAPERATLPALVQHASDIIMVIGSDATVRYVSPAFEAILGYPRRRSRGHVRARVRPPDRRRRVRAAIAGAPGTRDGAAEARLRHRDGTWRWFDVIVTDLFDDPSVEGWVANLRDITERKASEAALNEAQEAFRHAFDDAPIGMGLVDLDGQIHAREPGDGRAARPTQEELVGLEIRDLTHPDDRGSATNRSSGSRRRVDRTGSRSATSGPTAGGVGVAQRLARARRRRRPALPRSASSRTSPSARRWPTGSPTRPRTTP